MTNLYQEIDSRRNGHIGSRRNTRKISKGIIHVLISFNNIIVKPDTGSRVSCSSVVLVDSNGQ